MASHTCFKAQLEACCKHEIRSLYSRLAPISTAHNINYPPLAASLNTKTYATCAATMDASLHGKLEKKWKLSVNSYINAAKSTCQGNKRENRSKESETKKKPKRNRNMENKKLKNWKTKQNKRQTDRATRKCCQGDTLTRQHYCSPSCSLSLPALALSLPLAPAQFYLLQLWLLPRFVARHLR